MGISTSGSQLTAIGAQGEIVDRYGLRKRPGNAGVQIAHLNVGRGAAADCDLTTARINSNGRWRQSRTRDKFLHSGDYIVNRNQTILAERDAAAVLAPGI